MQFLIVNDFKVRDLIRVELKNSQEGPIVEFSITTLSKTTSEQFLKVINDEGIFFKLDNRFIFEI